MRNERHSQKTTELVVFRKSRLAMSNATTNLTMASAPAPKVYLLHDNDKVRSWVSKHHAYTCSSAAVQLTGM